MTLFKFETEIQDLINNSIENESEIEKYELEVMWQKDSNTAIYKYIESIFEINHNTKTITLKLK